MAQGSVTAPGANAYGPGGQFGRRGKAFTVRTPSTPSASPRRSVPQPAYHQPNSASWPGGRSPIITVLLNPSVMSAGRTVESANRTPSSSPPLVPSTPKYEVMPLALWSLAVSGAARRPSAGQQ